MTMKLTIHNHQAKVTVVRSAAALVINALKEPERDRKKNKNVKHNGNIALDDVIEIARVMRSHSMEKDLSRSIKEISGLVCLLGAPLMGKTPRICNRRFPMATLRFLLNDFDEFSFVFCLDCFCCCCYNFEFGLNDRGNCSTSEW